MRNGKRLTAGAAALAAAITFLAAARVGARSATGVANGATAEAKISVTQEGFTPSTVVLRRGVASRITFVRNIADTCATEIVVQELGINVALPLNEPVSVEVTPRSAGQYDYGCGDGVFHGTIIVR
jgi:plastocyanin domain-containing protein